LRIVVCLRKIDAFRVFRNDNSGVVWELDEIRFWWKTCGTKYGPGAEIYGRQKRIKTASFVRPIHYSFAVYNWNQFPYNKRVFSFVLDVLWDNANDSRAYATISCSVFYVIGRKLTRVKHDVRPPKTGETTCASRTSRVRLRRIVRKNPLSVRGSRRQYNYASYMGRPVVPPLAHQRHPTVKPTAEDRSLSHVLPYTRRRTSR